MAAACHSHSARRTAQYRNQGFERPFDNACRRAPAREDLISLSSAGSETHLDYKLVTEEPLVVVLPSDHPLAEREAIDPHDLVGETFIGISSVPRVLRAVINDYLKRSG